MMALLLFLILQTAAPRSSISGSVIDGGVPTLQPLIDARVELIRPSGSPMVLRSDANGRFAFSGLAAGRYRISVMRDGYQRKSAAIELTTGQQRNDVVIGLDLAPTLFGHVRDNLNVPVANVLVEAIKVVYGPRGDRSVASVESALTDDLGEYHLYWLDPGEYYIRAVPLPLKPGAAIPGNPPPESTGPSFAPTYHPGVRDPKDALLIRLRVGSNLSAFDFRLQPAGVVSLSGNISVLSTGEGVGTAIVASPAGAVASVQKFEGRSKDGPRVPANEKGEFALGGMLPGTYVVSAKYLFEGQELIVHRKVTLAVPERAFILKLVPGTNATGNVTTSLGQALDLRSVHVMLESIDPDLPSPSTTSISANGRFSFTRIEPGEYAIRFDDLPADVYLKSARSGEVDIQSKPLLIREVPLSAIDVVLGVDGGRLDGVVFDGSNRPFAGADVVLVPDVARRNRTSDYRATGSDADGRFTLRGIPPGEYKLFAWQNIEPNAWLNDVYMTGYEPFGVPLTIGPNATGSTSVRLIPID